MTVFKHPRGKTWRYDFWWKGRRYQGSTDQLTKAEATLVEAAIKTQLRQAVWGIAPLDRTRTPTFTAWAAYYLKHQRTRVRRPDLLQRTVRLVLAFWGARPAKDPVVGGVYHDLRLADALLDADWIEKFEQWMTDRGIAGSTKNSYRSAVSGMYRLAIRPAWRKKTHIASNPFVGVERDRQVSRVVTVSVAQLQDWMRAAAPHVRLAMAIAALAPKLRLASILALRWETHVDPALTFLTVYAHKTIGASGAPQVVPIDPQLREILQLARPPAARRIGPIITYRGKPVKDIKTALKRATTEAGLTYGRTAVTFHTLRHTMATLLAELGLPEHQRQATMGHLDARTTNKYTHLRPVHERPPLAALSAAVPLRQLFGLQGPVQGLPSTTDASPEGTPPAQTGPVPVKAAG